MPHKSAQAAPVTTSTRITQSVQAGKVYLVARHGSPPRPAAVLEVRIGKDGVNEAYVSFVGKDKRLDTWVPETDVGQEAETESTVGGPSQEALVAATLPSTTVEARPTTPAATSQTRAAPPSEMSSPEREHASMTRVRNFEDVRFGEYLIKTWYYSPYPKPSPIEDRAASPAPIASASKKRKLNGDASVNGNGLHLHDSNGVKREQSVQELYALGKSKVADGVKGRLWVCDLCFKYMRTRAAWERHTTSCDMLTPPGRRVYQKGSYTLWEVDGAQAPLYCQGLSLFGKLFIDHKSVFFHVENFLFYVLCDAATSRRDQVMAFFSKEKVSYDDYNLACIITFPPFQNRGFGKLLIEFSYYLTLHPSTRPASLSPGTPERPLSDLGLKGYTAYWASVILRFCRAALENAPPVPPANQQPQSSPAKAQRPRRSSAVNGRHATSSETLQGVDVVKTSLQPKGQYSISLSLSDLARACHLRLDDVISTLTELGFLRHRRRDPSEADEGAATSDANGANKGDEWIGVEVVITRDAVDRAWEDWKVRPQGVLDETCVLL